MPVNTFCIQHLYIMLNQIPVSYTHLDVYKRQTLYSKANQICEQTYYRNLRVLREAACSDFPISAIAESKKLSTVSFNKLEVQAPVTNTPVSYTHLDVYKRQALYKTNCAFYNRIYVIILIFS